MDSDILCGSELDSDMEGELVIDEDHMSPREDSINIIIDSDNAESNDQDSQLSITDFVTIKTEPIDMNDLPYNEEGVQNQKINQLYLGNLPESSGELKSLTLVRQNSTDISNNSDVNRKCFNDTERNVFENTSQSEELMEHQGTADHRPAEQPGTAAVDCENNLDVIDVIDVSDACLQTEFVVTISTGGKIVENKKRLEKKLDMRNEIQTKSDCVRKSILENKKRKVVDLSSEKLESSQITIPSITVAENDPRNDNSQKSCCIRKPVPENKRYGPVDFDPEELELLQMAVPSLTVVKNAASEAWRERNLILHQLETSGPLVSKLVELISALDCSKIAVNMDRGEIGWIGWICASYPTSEDAQAALDYLQKNPEKGLTIQRLSDCSRHLKDLATFCVPPDQSRWDGCTICVKFVSDRATESRLRTTFPDALDVVLHVASTRELSQNARRTAFLLYKSHDDAVTAVKKYMDANIEMDGYRLALFLHVDCPQDLVERPLKLSERDIILRHMKTAEKISRLKSTDPRWLSVIARCQKLIEKDDGIRRSLGLAIPSSTELDAMTNLKRISQFKDVRHLLSSHGLNISDKPKNCPKITNSKRLISDVSTVPVKSIPSTKMINEVKDVDERLNSGESNARPRIIFSTNSGLGMFERRDREILTNPSPSVTTETLVPRTENAEKFGMSEKERNCSNSKIDFGTTDYQPDVNRKFVQSKFSDSRSCDVRNEIQRDDILQQIMKNVDEGQHRWTTFVREKSKNSPDDRNCMLFPSQEDCNKCLNELCKVASAISDYCRNASSSHEEGYQPEADRLTNVHYGPVQNGMHSVQNGKNPVRGNFTRHERKRKYPGESELLQSSLKRPNLGNSNEEEWSRFVEIAQIQNQKNWSGPMKYPEFINGMEQSANDQDRWRRNEQSYGLYWKSPPNYNEGISGQPEDILHKNRLRVLNNFVISVVGKEFKNLFENLESANLFMEILMDPMRRGFNEAWNVVKVICQQNNASASRSGEWLTRVANYFASDPRSSNDRTQNWDSESNRLKLLALCSAPSFPISKDLNM